MAQLTIFYDGACPLCAAEIRLLSRYDKLGRLQLEDIHSADFCERFAHIDRQKAERILHGQLANGQLLFGLDVTCLAWKLVGKPYRLAWLRWPLVRPLADRCYLLFARHRHRISAWLTGQPRCKRCIRADCSPPCA